MKLWSIYLTGMKKNDTWSLVKICMIKLEYNVIIYNLCRIIEKILLENDRVSVIRFSAGLPNFIMASDSYKKLATTNLTFYIRYWNDFNRYPSKFMFLVLNNSLFLHLSTLKVLISFFVYLSKENLLLILKISSRNGSEF